MTGPTPDAGPLAGDPALLAYVADLRARLPGLTVPDFDPLDGGVCARVLVLLEKPSATAAMTGVVSRDHGSATARTVRAALADAGLPRGETIVWNLVPAWNGTVRVTAAEVRDGLAHLARLLPLLPRLDAAILAGRHAARAAGLLGHLDPILSAHPSPNVRAAFPARWAAIPALWAGAASRR